MYVQIKHENKRLLNKTGDSLHNSHIIYIYLNS